MAQISAVTVFDGASTPVQHVLTPVSVGRDASGTVTATYREQISTLPAEAQIRMELKQRLLKSGVIETRTRVVVPVMESISGQNASGYTAAPKVAYEDTEEWVSYAHPRSTIAGRRLAKQLLTNIANNVATTVASPVTGVFDEAVSQLIMPT